MTHSKSKTRNKQSDSIKNDEGTEQSEDQKPKLEPTASFDGLVDIVSLKGAPCFLINKGGELSTTYSIDEGERILIPPPADQLPWILPRGEEILRIFEDYLHRPSSLIHEELIEDLIEYHKSHSELPSEKHYTLLAAWDIHTYLLNHFHYSPIVCLFAVPERGKTRTGKSMLYVAFRGVHVESLREAYLIRITNNLNATLFIDVVDIWKKAERNQSEDIILQRFERGATVPRVTNPDKGKFRDTQYYSVYGATIIGINEPADRILETRCIQINMPETLKVFEEPATPEGALALKERLTALRAWMMQHELPAMSKPAKNRLGDIMCPLFQVTELMNNKRIPDLISLTEELEGARKIEKSESLEGLIIKAMIDLEHKVSCGVLRVSDVLELINHDRNDRYKVAPSTVGRKLASLGFQRTRVGTGVVAVYYDIDKILNVAERYGIQLHECDDTPDSENYDSSLF